jgi:hypothetical protein
VLIEHSPTFTVHDFIYASHLLEASGSDFQFTTLWRFASQSTTQNQQFSDGLVHEFISRLQWVVGAELPELLRLWNRWSIAVHFGLALVGVSAVRDADAVVEHRIRKLKAEAIQEDIATIRRAAINDNPLVIAAAKVRGIMDGINLAIQLIRDKSEFLINDVKQIHDPSTLLCLPGGGERNVTGIGKILGPVNAVPEIEAVLQYQASSLAQDQPEGSGQVGSSREEDTARVCATGEQSVEVSSDIGEQNVGEQAKVPKRVSKADGTPVQAGEQMGEQSPENSESHYGHQLADDLVGKGKGEHIRSEHSALEGEQSGEPKSRVRDDRSVQSVHNLEGKGEQKGEQPAQVILLSAAHRRGRSTSDEQPPDEQSAQWLKNLLPEATNGTGWWEVRVKPKGFALVFRWRDPDLQVLTVQNVTRDQIEQLEQIESEHDAKGRIREQIVVSLRKLSLEPAKREKARVAAEKLGIDIPVHAVSTSISREI